MAVPKPVKVKIYYDSNLKEITGKDFEEAVISEGMEFRLFLHYIFSSYPEIPQKFIPTTLGFKLNGKFPQNDTVLCDGDELQLAAFSLNQVREGIKKKIENIIRHYKIDLDFDKLEKMIYDEENQNNFNDLADIFTAKISEIDEINEVLRIVNAAWNCFPHRRLNDLCPMEKLAQGQKGNNQY